MTDNAFPEQHPPVQEKRMQDFLAYDLSLRVAQRIKAIPNSCFSNAWRALITLPEIFRPGGRLVEGWFVVELDSQVVMNEHGWCELANGAIVDPSLPLLVPPDQPVYYFPGVIRSWEETEALEGELFPHVRFDGKHGMDGLGHPAYRAAHDAARQKVQQLAQAADPPKEMVFLTAQDPENALGVGQNGIHITIIFPGCEEGRSYDG